MKRARLYAGVSVASVAAFAVAYGTVAVSGSQSASPANSGTSAALTESGLPFISPTASSSSSGTTISPSTSLSGRYYYTIPSPRVRSRAS